MPLPVVRLARFVRYRVERPRRMARLTRLGPAVAAARRPKLLHNATRLSQGRRGAIGLGVGSVSAEASIARRVAEQGAPADSTPTPISDTPEVPGLSEVEREWLFGDPGAALARAVAPTAEMLAPLPENVRRERAVQRLLARGGLERGRGARIIEGARGASEPEPAAPSLPAAQPAAAATSTPAAPETPEPTAADAAPAAPGVAKAATPSPEAPTAAAPATPEPTAMPAAADATPGAPSVAKAATPSPEAPVASRPGGWRLSRQRAEARPAALPTHPPRPQAPRTTVPPAGPISPSPAAE